MNKTLLSTFFLLAFIFIGKAQATYTLIDSDVRVVKGVIISSTLTDNFGEHYQPNIIIPNRLDGQMITHKN